jgi:hypothetical protein
MFIALWMLATGFSYGKIKSVLLKRRDFVVRHALSESPLLWTAWASAFLAIVVFLAAVAFERWLLNGV